MTDPVSSLERAPDAGDIDNFCLHSQTIKGWLNFKDKTTVGLKYIIKLTRVLHTHIVLPTATNKYQ